MPEEIKIDDLMWPLQVGKTMLLEFVPICCAWFWPEADGGRIPG